MANRSTELIRHVKENSPNGVFRPFAYYDADSDTLTFYFRNEPDYSKRINKLVTIHLSMGSHELVGCQIKGVRRVVDEIGDFDVEVRHGRIKLSIVLLPFLGSIPPEDEDSRQLFRQLGRAASDAEIETAEFALA